MTNQKIYRQMIGHLSHHYTFFDSVSAYHEWVEKELKQLSGANRQVMSSLNRYTGYEISAGSNWFGSPKPKSINELATHTTYLGMGLANKVREKVKAYLADYLRELSQIELPTPVLAYNDRGIGVFSFERAAMGLYKHIPINTETPLAKTHSQLRVALQNSNISTNVREVYASFENRESSRPGVQIYLVAGGNCEVEGNDMLYVGLGCAELISFLEARGIATEVNVLNATQFEKQAIVGVIRVKRFQDKTDLNQILLMSSDPRYYRYQGFMGLIALSNYFSLTLPADFGHASKVFGYNFVAALQAEPSKGFVFEQSYSLEACAKEVKRIIKTYQLEKRHGNNH